MEPEILAVLIDKYLDGTASREEIKTLLDWYRSADHADMEIPLESEAEKEALRLSMRASLLDYAGKRPYTGKRPYAREHPYEAKWDRQRSYRWMIAAAMTGLIALGTYFLYFNKKKAPIPLSGAGNEFRPGGQKAILTLGDGTKIALDSSVKGVLAEQGAATIEKMADGKLVYQVAKDISGKIFYNTMETPRGGEYQLVLPDGTKVWLNSATSIRYPNVFTGNNREVEVTGEAFFDVAKDESKPFMVKTRKVRTTVLGTAFNVMAYPEEDAVKTTLLSGAVNIVLDDQTRTIKPGQEAIAGNAGNMIKVQEADIDKAIAWKNGVFDFDGADIPTIMRQVARWYDVEIRYEGDLSGIILSGVVSRREKCDLLLEALGRTREVTFRTEGNRITVMPAGVQ
jgi:transmembrane sensor